jgi:hypothetical protein
MSDTLPPTAVAGAEAPFEETAQPLTRDAGGIAPAVNPLTGEPYATEDWHTMTPAQRARHNERELKPLTYRGPGDVGPAAADPGPKQGGIAEAITAAADGHLDPFYARLKAERAAAADDPRRKDIGGQPPAAVTHEIRRIRRATGAPRPPVPDLAVGPDVAPPPHTDASAPPAMDTPNPADVPKTEDLSHAPAASDDDSPRRGVPRPNIGNQRPGKEITGGFGDEGQLAYYALNGVELRLLVEDMIKDLNQRLVNDLRFSEALVYPQVSVRVVVEVQGFAHDADFVVDKVLPATHDARAKTPLALARQVADEICFVVLAEARETDDAGNPVTAPDAFRDDLGLPKPRKRLIHTGPMGQTQIVDVAG